MKTKVTVAIPCYNAEKYIEATIKSVLAQTYKNFTLLIVDNNSKDKTLSIISKINDKRIKVRKNRKNIGMFQNMNECIRLTNTPYLKILCADDLIAPTLLEVHAKIFDKYPSVNLIYNSSIIINDKNKNLITRKYFSKNKKIDGGVLINLILKSGRNPIGEPSSVSLRTKVLKEYSLNFDTNFKYISDLDLWIKILKNGDAYYIKRPLSFFRMHHSSATTSLFKKGIKEHSKLISIYSDQFNLNLIDIIVVNIKLYVNLLIKSLLIRFI